MMNTTIFARAVLAAFFIAAGSLAAANGGAAPPPAAIRTAVEVNIDDMKFQPQHVKVRVGTTVKWVNNEKRNNHSVYFREEGLPESERFFPGESWSRTFEKPGLYPYICGPHPEMTGTVEVVE